MALPAGALIGAVAGFLNERLRDDGGKAGGAGGAGGDEDGDDAGEDGLGGFGSETAAQRAAAAAAAAAAATAHRLPTADDSVEADSSADSTVMFDPFREGGISAHGLTGRRV